MNVCSNSPDDRLVRRGPRRAIARGPGGRAIGATILAIALLACPTISHAQEATSSSPPSRPPVFLAIENCDGSAEPTIRRGVAIELHATLVESPDADTTRASVTCDGDHALLRVDDPITGKSLLRSVSVAGVPAVARPRFVALAVAELVTASWTELALNPAPVATPDPIASSAPPPSDDARAAVRALVEARIVRNAPIPPAVARERRAIMAVAAMGSVRWLPIRSLVFVGGGIRIGATITDRFGVLGDVRIMHGETPVSVGRLAIDAVETSAAVVVHRRFGPIRLRGGLGARVALAQWSGVVDRPDDYHVQTQRGVWFGPIAVGGLSLELGRYFEAGVLAEAGYTVVGFGALVNGAREAALEGPWLSGELLVGARW